MFIETRLTPRVRGAPGKVGAPPPACFQMAPRKARQRRAYRLMPPAPRTLHSGPGRLFSGFQILDYLATGIEAGRTGHAAAGMSSRSA